MKDFVYVAVAFDGYRSWITRIFRNVGDAVDSSEVIQKLDRPTAVRSIRLQVFLRANSECQHCGQPLTWNTMHMHEKIPRGKGGEISLENSIALCFQCHEGRPDSAHGNRRPRFGEEIK